MGRDAPAGNTVKYPGVEGETTVTFKATALAPVGIVVAPPVTVRLRVLLTQGCWPISRVSSRRLGVTPTKPPAETVAEAGPSVATTPAIPIRPAVERASTTRGTVKRDNRCFNDPTLERVLLDMPAPGLKNKSLDRQGDRL